MSRKPKGFTKEYEAFVRVRVKQELRQRMRAVRGALPMKACEARSARVAEQVLALDAFRNAKTVLGFASIRKEVQTLTILEAAWAAGKQVVLPRIVDQALVLHRVETMSELSEGAFSVPEPAASAPQIEPRAIDFALVPALAADLRGHRIGYGGGYYDRLLPELTGAITCALVFDFQLVSEVPEQPMDVAVDLVVTDARVTKTS